jgi:hypothetical protein
VTDATWHHFVNINLIGELDESPLDLAAGLPEDPSVSRDDEGVPNTHGFLYSASGRAHFAQIKHYYINIAVWISRPSNHRCFHSRLVWEVLLNHRVIEATMDNPNIGFEKISHIQFYGIGTHALDVLGEKASQCRRLNLLLDLVRPIMPEIAPLIDPWPPEGPFRKEPGLPWLDLNPMLAIAVGAGLVAVRDRFLMEKDGKTRKLDVKIEDKHRGEIWKYFQEGAERGLKLGRSVMEKEMSMVSKLL